MRIRITACVLGSLLISSSAVGFQGGLTKPSSQLPIEEIIQRFARAESENKTARNNYTFTQDVEAMTIGEADSITGRFRRTSDVVYDDLGNRIERITYFPPSTLVGLSFSKEDMQDLAGVQPFALSSGDLSKYQVDYVGKEKVDQLNTYVFAVKPRQVIKGERYLQGKIWVDDEDFQIVKVAGQSVPEVKDQKFPRFESYRENIDGRYWFPTYVYADDVLEFKNGAIRIRLIVRYTNYKKFTGRIRVTDESEAASDEELNPTDQKKPAPVKPPAPAPGDKRPPEP